MEVGAKDVINDLVLNEPVRELTPAAGNNTTRHRNTHNQDSYKKLKVKFKNIKKLLFCRKLIF